MSDDYYLLKDGLVKAQKKESNQEWIKKYEKVLPIITTDLKIYPFIIKRAIGAEVWDMEDNSYLDFTSQIGVMNLGHGYRPINEAMKNQIDELNFVIATDWPHKLEIEWAEKLLSIMPGDFEKKVWPEIGGAEANIAAVEIINSLTSPEAELFLPKSRATRNIWLAFEGGFHGRKGYAKDLTLDKAVQKSGYQNNLRVVWLPFPDEKFWVDGVNNETGRTYSDEINRFDGRYFSGKEVQAIFMELVQGQGGVNVADKKSVRQLVDWCQINDILIVDDEIQTGFGRTGKMFAFEHYDFYPDIVTLAKSIGAGRALGAVVYKTSLFGGFEKEILKSGVHSGTFNADPVACAASIAFIDALIKKRDFDEEIDEIEDEEIRIPKINGTFIDRAAALEDFMRDRLMSMYKNNIPYFDNRPKRLGLIAGIDIINKFGRPLPQIRDKIIHQCFKNGLLVSQAGTHSIRLMPPLTISLRQLNLGLEKFENSLIKVKNI